MSNVRLSETLRSLSFEELGFYYHVARALGDGPLSFKELEEVLNTHHSTVSRLLKQIKDKGLIEVIDERSKTGDDDRLVYKLPDNERGPK